MYIRGFSQPFAKVRAVFTFKTMDKGDTPMKGFMGKGFMGKLLKLKILDVRNFFAASFQYHLE